MFKVVCINRGLSQARTKGQRIVGAAVGFVGFWGFRKQTLESSGVRLWIRLRSRRVCYEDRERKKSPVLSATLFSRLLADFSDFAFVLGPTVFGEIGLK